MTISGRLIQWCILLVILVCAWTYYQAQSRGPVVVCDRGAEGQWVGECAAARPPLTRRASAA